MQEYVLWYQELGMHDVNRVGGKNASLGEMISNLANAGVKVPGGFATTAYAFNEFLEQSGLEAKIHEVLDSLDVDDVGALAEAGKNIRQWIIDTPFQGKLEEEIRTAREEEVADHRCCICRAKRLGDSPHRGGRGPTTHRSRQTGHQGHP